MKNLSILSMALLLPLAAACTAPGVGGEGSEWPPTSGAQFQATPEWLLGCDISASPVGRALAQPLNWFHCEYDIEYDKDQGGDQVLLSFTGGVGPNTPHNFHVGYMSPAGLQFTRCIPLTPGDPPVCVRVGDFGGVSAAKVNILGQDHDIQLQGAPGRHKAIVRAVAISEDLAHLIITYREKTVTLLVWS